VRSALGSSPSFEPPGPGTWTLDTAHFPQPASRFARELFGEPARRGFQEATARYGLLMDHIEWSFVQGWAYLCPRPIAPLRDAGERLTRVAWDELVGSTPALGERLATSAGVFEDRRWRGDVARWDDQTKPEMRRDHMELQAVDPARLGTRQLLSHLQRCRRNLQRAVYEHHRLNVAPVIPVGDLLVHAGEWAGQSPAELVGLVSGGGPLSLGAAPELARLATAIREDPPAAAGVFSDDEPRAILAALVSTPGAVGAAASRYVELVGCWSAGGGTDVGEPCLLEMPHVLVETVRAAVARERGGADADAEAQAGAATELAGAVRAAVPPDRREAFDELLAEARATHRLRDERAIYCDVWACGLTRRAILAAGKRLAGAGAIERAEDLVEAGYAEIRSLLEGAPGPSGEELAARGRYRLRADEDQAPAVLHGRPSAPPPLAWLPPGAARTERAFRAYVGAMSGEAQEAAGTGGTVRGLAASPGTHEGRARVVRSPSELGRVGRGDVLVTGSTTPAFNAILPLVGAIVTDRGGLLSHAAIVAREYGIPAVVGTGEATRRIPDGALVRVDGASGEAGVIG